MDYKSFEPIGNYSIIRPWLFKFNARLIHKIVLTSLSKLGKYRWFLSYLENKFRPRGEIHKIFGKYIRNRIGLAAGFDKNGTALNSLHALGFGAIEVGSVTLKKREGNHDKVLERIDDSELVNSLGCPNKGYNSVNRKLKKFKKSNCLLGVNIISDLDPRISLYRSELVTLYQFMRRSVDYVVLNVSCPNILFKNELKDLSNISNLLRAMNTHRKLIRVRTTPVMVKLPYLESDKEIKDIVDLVIKYNCEGIIIGNTMPVRKGGLSGLTLRENTLSKIRMIRKEYPDLKIFASGGIGLDGDKNVFIEAGADMVQIYTSLIYRGPEILKNL